MRNANPEVEAEAGLACERRASPVVANSAAPSGCKLVTPLAEQLKLTCVTFAGSGYLGWLGNARVMEDEYRKRASMARADAARNAHEPNVHRAFLQIAAQWDRLADQATKYPELASAPREDLIKKLDKSLS